jgi:phthiodiolone/phenolphthiodiolone dimycocerosates ketoreductase
VPAAAFVDSDTWMDPFIAMANQGGITPRIKVGLTAVESLRRHPSVLAQSILSVDHMVGGGTFVAIAAGENKQLKPYGVARERIFDHMEDAVQMIKLLIESDGPVSFQGKVWNMNDAIVALRPVNGKPPEIWTAGANPRAKRIAGQYADGWVTFAPGPCSAEQFAQDREDVRRHAIEAGRDPDSLRYACVFMCNITDDADELDALENHPVKRWDAMVLVPTGKKWREWGLEHPLGDDWSYPRDLIPMEVTREQALDLVSRVPREAVQRTHISGTVEEATKQIDAYIDAGCDFVIAANFIGLFESGRFADQGAGGAYMRDVFKRLRQLHDCEVPWTFQEAERAAKAAQTA